MTQRAAIQLLIKHAAANAAGVGQGIRKEVTEDEKQQVRKAISVVWRYTGYHFPPSDTFFSNLGL